MLTEKLQEIMNSSLSVFHPFEYLFIFGQIQKDLVYHYSVLRYLINRNVLLVYFEYSVYLDSHLNAKTEGEIKLITLVWHKHQGPSSSTTIQVLRNLQMGPIS
jgi:hypothetical protein